MGVTAGGLPYPEPTEPVAGGATAIKALAEALDGDTPAAIVSGRVGFPSTAVNATSSLAVTFPVGKFTSEPRVQVTSLAGAPLTRPVSTGTATPSAVTLYAGNSGGAAVTLAAYWLAIQDRAQTAAVVAAPAEGETFGTVTCPTEGCPNQGIPIEVQTGWVDDDGVAHPVDGFVCGVCGAALDPVGSDVSG